MEVIKEDRYFDPDEKWKGLAVVITNFLSGKRIRSGAVKDKKYMEESFKRLGFEVICHDDVKASDLTDLLEKYSKETDLNCFAFAISSHGCEMEKKEDDNTKNEKKEKDKQEKKIIQHAIEMFDGNYFFTDDILVRFSDEKCPGLRNIPKIFLIEACRIPESKSTKEHRKAGIGFDEGCYLPQNAKSNPANPGPAEPNPVKLNPQTETKMKVDYYTPDATDKMAPSVEDQDEIDPAKPQIIYPLDLVEITLVPCFNDMLIMFACPQDHYAIRNTLAGSYMLRLFYKSVVACDPKSANLLDILRDVTQEMSELEVYGFHEYKIVPSIVHKLRKDVIFTHGKI